MLDYLRNEFQFLLLIPIWVVTGMYFGPLAYLVIPASIFLMKNREMYPEIFMALLIILILSDMNPEIYQMRWVKTVKHFVMVTVALIFIMDREKFAPHSKIFSIFLPFVVYSYIPLIFSGAPILGAQKTLSYTLLLLVIPNYVLYSYRKLGWSFFRNLIYFVIVLLVAGYLIRFVNPRMVFIAGRFRAFFGNPNGVGIFVYLIFVLFTLLNHIKKDLFSVTEKVVIYLLLAYFLLLCGSRTSLMAVFIFLFFSRFYSVSPFIGFIIFIIFLAIVEVVSSNMQVIVFALGLQDYLRVETLDNGSGRYIAWNFAWEKIQDFFLMGGGFGNDEYIMRQHYPYLRSLGHHGGVHNSYLTMWFNMGLIGVLIYFRSFMLIFFKSSKKVLIAFPIMFSVLFSVLYESWLNGSLNPFTITLLISLTIISESEIVEWKDYVGLEDEEEEEDLEEVKGILPGLRTA